ncbi:MAG: TldD/PmbA family protein [Candidatus Hodarchaeales archaeon]|jgi:PmbA protein
MEFETLNDELLSKVETSLKYARSLDQNAEFEVYLAYRTESSVNINQGVVQASDGVLAGSAVRVALGTEGHKKVSFSSSTGLDLDRIKKNIEQSLSLNKSLTIEDPRFKSFAYPSHESGKEGIICHDILTITTSDLVPKCTTMIKDAKSVHPQIKVVEASMDAISEGFAIGNSNGVLNASRLTKSSRSVEATGLDGDERKVGYISEQTREKVMEADGAGEKAATNAIQQFGGKKINETAVLPTVWDNIAAACYLGAGLGYSIQGSYVVEGMSPLADKIGEQIAHPKLNINDDGTKPTGIATNACDAEGITKRKNSVIENGILKSFLFNSYYGNIFGAESTASCARSAGIFGGGIPYETTPGIASTNVDVIAGTKTEEELIALIDGKGILIREMPMGIFHSSVATGDFSAVANTAFLIENGEIRYPLKSATVAGNFYTGLKNLEEIGSNKQMTFLNVEIPSLLFNGFSVVA